MSDPSLVFLDILYTGTINANYRGLKLGFTAHSGNNKRVNALSLPNCRPQNSFFGLWLWDLQYQVTTLVNSAPLVTNSSPVEHGKSVPDHASQPRSMLEGIAEAAMLWQEPQRHLVDPSRMTPGGNSMLKPQILNAGGGGRVIVLCMQTGRLAGAYEQL